VTADDFEATETWEKARQIDFPVEDGEIFIKTILLPFHSSEIGGRLVGFFDFFVAPKHYKSK
jgi:hypothetical protein